ncbi:hypothetical protein IAT38_000264 [Cryptococcus sp. DSM 104549]
MSSTTFVLTSVPNPTSLPPAPSLSLLPFSLGPNSAPYTSRDAPIGSYFCPRPLASSAVKEEEAKQDARGEGGSTGASSAATSHPNTTATFRGRAVVGQYLPLPAGYRGIILSAAQRPDRGGNEVYAPAPATSTSTPLPSTTTSSRTRTRNGLPTPAPSSASVASTQVEDDDDGIRRSPRKASVLARIKGAGQAALAKPRRRAAPVVRKRYRLDSESEDEEAKPAVADEEEESSIVAGLGRTPSKRARTALATPRKGAGAGAGEEGVPEIVIQEATPLKQPLATPRKRLGGVGAGSPIPEVVAEETAGDVEMASAELSAPEPTRATTPSSSTSQVQLTDEPNPTSTNEETIVEVQEVQDTDSSGQNTPALDAPASAGPLGSNASEEKIIPSPATEDDPPVFNVPPPPTHAPADEDEDVSAPAGSSTSEGALAAVPQVESEAPPPVQEDAPAAAPEEGQTAPEEDITGLIRELHPTASFSGFTLYTPDAPLAGFRADECVAPVKFEVKEEVKAEGKGEKSEADAEKAGEAADEGIQVRQSWWRTGGGGEGGDEMVRAMGEWLGLVESLNKPVYLEGLDDSDDDE